MFIIWNQGRSGPVDRTAARTRSPGHGGGRYPRTSWFREGIFSEPGARLPLPPHLVADLGVGRDRVAAGDQGVGETDEAGLLLGIARGLIRTARSDLVEADVLRLPDRQGELETPTTTSFDGLR